MRYIGLSRSYQCSRCFWARTSLVLAPLGLSQDRTSLTLIRSSHLEARPRFPPCETSGLFLMWRYSTVENVTVRNGYVHVPNGTKSNLWLTFSLSSDRNSERTPWTHRSLLRRKNERLPSEPCLQEFPSCWRGHTNRSSLHLERGRDLRNPLL